MNFVRVYLSMLICWLSLIYAFMQSFRAPPLLSHLFMLTQEVSKMPISLSTPSKMTLMTSGGMRRERISDSASGLMFPTARFASSTKGYRAEIIRRLRGEEGIGTCRGAKYGEVEVRGTCIHINTDITSHSDVLPALPSARHLFWPFVLQSLTPLEPSSL